MKLKKSLGQNFLNSNAVLQMIVLAAEIKPNETILEVGPGRGNLTRGLILTGARVVAVEKDQRLIPELQKMFKKEIEEKKLILIEADILEWKPGKAGLENGKYKIVANIPYYITGQFLKKFLESDCQPNKMVLLLQKEVVSRILAYDKKESLLSVGVKVFGAPKRVGVVSRNNFKPAPDVDSAIISINDISKKFFGKISEKEFFGIIKTGFSHKRKKLLGNLKKKFSDEKLFEAFKRCDFDQNIRAEDLSVRNWFCLSENL